MNKPPHEATSARLTSLFRYTLVAQVLARTLGGQRESAAVRAVAAQLHVDVAGRQRRVSVRTLQRWMAAWHQGGIDALTPKQRQPTEASRVLSAELLSFLDEHKRADPSASVPALLDLAREKGVVGAEQAHRATAWRALRRMGVPTRRRRHKGEGDARRWRYLRRMRCVLCDGKHFRAGPSRLRRVALVFLDNATRFALGGLVGTAESTDMFLQGLVRVVRKYGLMGGLYLDRGPGFVSLDTYEVVRRGLDAWLVHGRNKYPEGRGAIERFNRTLNAGLLRSLDGAVEVDPSCASLTLRLQHYLRRYNDSPHETLGKGVTPRQRWEQGVPLRFPADEADLLRRFVVRDSRVVSADHVIQHGGELWEAPRGLARQRVEIVRDVLTGALSVPHQGRLVRLHRLDPNDNATERRGYPNDRQPQLGEGVPETAATTAFNRDFGPVVGPDGGFAEVGEADDNHHPDEV